MASYLRKYATGTGADLYINIPKAASANHAVSADWTPAAGDVKVSKDGGAAANIGTLPTAIAMGNSTIWKFVFTDAELTAKFISVTVSDSATKAVDDTGFSIETFGNASAQIAFDLSTATQPVNVTQISADSTAADNLELALDDTAGAVPWFGIIDQGTAQAATATTIRLRSAAVFGDSTPIGATVWAFGSTQGYWQVQVITAYVSSTDTATVPGWPVTPSGTITYKVFGSAAGSGVAQSGDAYAIVASGTFGNAALEARTLSAALLAKFTAHLGGMTTGLVTSGSSTTTVAFNVTTGIAGGVPSATTDFYKNRVIIFITGALTFQTASISAYNGSTKIATVSALTSAPSSGDTFILV